MSKRKLTRLFAMAAIAVGSATLATPARAATSSEMCSTDDIINALNQLCPGGGRAWNIQNYENGCSFEFTCY
jgi:hypothetical protein